MALFHAHFGSGTLNLACSAEVILPDRRTDPARPLACLWLLHGLSDDHTIWQRRTSIERYAAAYRLAVVMPAVDRSFYADMQHGNKYWSFLSEELPELMRQYFPLSARREDNFAAGLSMGGYGAFKLALNLPERYAAAASLSGALDMTGIWMSAERRAILQLISDKSPKGTPNDLLHAAAKLAKSRKPRPRLYQWCGTEDFLYADNLRFRDHARKTGLPVDYSEGPGGHTWDRWDEQIVKVMEWIKVEKA
ncbi:MAG: alpha/beta hydrolase family protein [bacterium]